MIVLSVPDKIEGETLSTELYNAGFRYTGAAPLPREVEDKPLVMVVGDELHILIDGVTSIDPSQEEYQAMLEEEHSDAEEVKNKLRLKARARAKAANADLAKKIQPIVKAHIPPPPLPPLTPLERLAEVAGLTKEEMKAAIKEANA